MAADIALKPLEVTPLHERVYQELRRALISGKFEPGTKLTSRKVAVALGTSDMPVRAALARLVAEGGLVQRANGTMIVPLVSRTKFTEVMQIRALLEAQAARMATGRIDAKVLTQARRHANHLTEAVRDRDIVKYLDHNQRLKFTIYGCCGSKTLLSLIGLLWLQAGPLLRELITGLDGIMNINYHDEALDALERGDADAASAAISRDILEGMQFLLKTAQFAAEDGEGGDQPAEGEDFQTRLAGISRVADAQATGRKRKTA